MSLALIVMLLGTVPVGARSGVDVAQMDPAPSRMSARQDETPSGEPTILPTIDPDISPTVEPSIPATVEPSIPPTVEPSPTPSPSERPSDRPTPPPTVPASQQPTTQPTRPPVITPPPGPPPTEPAVRPTDTTVGALVTLTDRFDDAGTGLLGETRVSDIHTTGAYENGRYRMEITGPEVAPDLIALVRSPVLVDATIEATARIDGTVDGRYVMAICREVPGSGGYRAYLSPEDGYFAITRFQPGSVPEILQDGFSDHLLVGNEAFSFAFSCSGFVLELRVNGDMVSIAADNSFAAGTISIGTGYFADAPSGPVTTFFEDLTVSGTAGPADAAAAAGTTNGDPAHRRPTNIRP